MKLRDTILSRSAIINVNNNYGKEEMNAYLFARQLSSQYKHPIILNYKQQLNNIRLSLKLSDKRFRYLMNKCLSFGLFTIEGANLRLLSKNKDWKQFKTYKKNDYHNTKNPKMFKDLVIIENYYKKQHYAIKQKHQTYLKANNSDAEPNYAITISCRGLSKLLKLNSASGAKKVIDFLNKRGLINLNKRKETITKAEFKRLLAKGDKSIRYCNENKYWYKILASTFEPKFNFKRIKLTKFDLLSEKEQITYLGLGYSIDYINTILD